MNVSGILLASGFSRRMRQDKLLMEIDGTPLVERVVQAAVGSVLSETILVYRRDEVAMAGKRHGLKCVPNPDAEEGQSASIRLGLGAARADADGYLFMVGDQPFITPVVINEIIQGWSSGPDTIAVSKYGERQGNPVLFPAAFKEQLLKLRGDGGGREIIKQNPDTVMYVSLNNIQAGQDIDTREDYQNLTEECR